MTCCIPHCGEVAHEGLQHQLCVKHAKRIYLEVKDMVESATVAQLASAARQPRSPSGMRNRNEQQGDVYFMLVEAGAVKIGFSTNVKARARALGAKAILATFPGTRRDERALHAKFGPYWIEGEYFRDCPEIRAYIEGAA